MDLEEIIKIKMIELAKAIRTGKDKELLFVLHDLLIIVLSNFDKLIQLSSNDIINLNKICIQYFNQQGEVSFNDLYRNECRAKELNYKIKSFYDPDNNEGYKFELEYYKFLGRIKYFQNNNKKLKRIKIIWCRDLLNFIAYNIDYFKVNDEYYINTVINSTKKLLLIYPGIKKSLKIEIESLIDSIVNNDKYINITKKTDNYIKKVLK